MPDLLVEIGTEELPAPRVREAAAALRDGLAAALSVAGLLEGWSPEGQPILGTPRRLAASLAGVRERQADRRERLWGPPVAAAFGPDGNPTKAGEGFARSSGVPLEAMGRGERVPGRPPYLYADRTVKGRSASEIVAEVLPKVAASLPFRRAMRWPQSDMPFARPIRTLVVLLGTEVVPCRIAGVDAGRETRGHAFLRPKPLAIPAADLDAYRDLLRKSRVLVDFGERSREIVKQVRRARAGVLGSKGRGPWDEADDDLLLQVAGLVEWPQSVVGSFEARYRSLPPALLVTAMAHHLRFFTLRAADGKVLDRFVSVTDREKRHGEGIREGNERVLRARLYDAAFFFDNDRRRRLEDFRPALAGVDFHRGLGTLLDKSQRVRKVAVSLCDTLNLPGDTRAAADRAAYLLKCDLLTEVVKEFPELQGVIGAHYAALDEEAEGVSRGIAAQYLPRGEWDPLLDDDTAAVVSAAEKADSLAAYFSIGEEPTGSADPFGLRRHALGLLRILERKGWPLSLRGALAPAAREWNLAPEALERLVAFVWARADQEARARGWVEFLDTLGPWTDAPYPEFWGRLAALKALAAAGEWRDLVALVERTGHMGEASKGAISLDRMPPEVMALAAAVEKASGIGTKDPRRFAVAYLACLRDPVATLFDKVLVDDPKEPVRRNAVKHLLQEAFDLFRVRVGDLRRLGSGARPARE
jgi:glycyl-tRNA synthetase beta chain